MVESIEQITICEKNQNTSYFVFQGVSLYIGDVFLVN